MTLEATLMTPTAPDAVHRATGFFDRDDVRAGLGEAANDRNGNFNAGAPGDAVEHQRQRRLFGNSLEVAKQALGRRLVVVRHHEQGRVGAGFLGFDGERDRFVGGVGAGAGDDLAATGGDFDGEFDDLPVFLVVERGRFTGCADGHNPADAVLDLELDQLRKCRFIEAAVAEWRNQRRMGTFKHEGAIVRQVFGKKQIFFPDGCTEGLF